MHIEVQRYSRVFPKHYVTSTMTNVQAKNVSGLSVHHHLIQQSPVGISHSPTSSPSCCTTPHIKCKRAELRPRIVLQNPSEILLQNSYTNTPMTKILHDDITVNTLTLNKTIGGGVLQIDNEVKKTFSSRQRKLIDCRNVRVLRSASISKNRIKG